MNYALLLTLLRVLFVPVVIMLMYVSDLWSALVFALAAVTDWADGYAARRFAQGTELGKFLDPLADKILALSVLLVLAVQLRVEVLSVLLLVAREFAVSGLRLTVLQKGGAVVAASRLAKWKTATQMVALFLLLAGWRFGLELYYVSVVLALASAVEYFWVQRSYLK